MPVTLYEPFDPRVEVIWRQLEARTRPAYFQTWGWIEAWLARAGADAPPLAVVHDEDGSVAAAAFVGEHAGRGGVRARVALHVEALGGEHGALLRAPGAHASLGDVVAALPAWDTLVVPAIDRAMLPDLAQLAPAYRVRIERQASAPHVDLDSVRGAAGGYVALVDLETRVQLQHAHRELGEVTVEVAHDVPHAHALFDELLRLQANTHGAPQGALADARDVDVHRQLIARRLPHGEIQLLRIAVDAGTIGVVYAFASHGRALFYAGGYAPAADPHVQPAYVCHAAAIVHAAASGLAFYELHGADAATRRHLATGATELAWVRLERLGVRDALGARWRDLRRAVARRLAPLPIGT